MKTHLTDERLIELSIGNAAASRAPGGNSMSRNAIAGDTTGDPHVAACDECRARSAQIVALLAEVTDVAAAEADAEFPADRLIRQQARILQRIEQEGRPGRLIAFPAGYPSAPFIARSRPASRWVAAAAVAGLVVGLVTGQLLPVGQSTGPAPRMVSNEADAGATLRAVSTSLSDDEFLGQVEAAGSTGPAALRPLDAMTPFAWEVVR
jgi:hypothetical protein